MKLSSYLMIRSSKCYPIYSVLWHPNVLCVSPGECVPPGVCKRLFFLFFSSLFACRCHAPSFNPPPPPHLSPPPPLLHYSANRVQPRRCCVGATSTRRISQSTQYLGHRLSELPHLLPLRRFALFFFFVVVQLLDHPLDPLG